MAQRDRRRPRLGEPRQVRRPPRVELGPWPHGPLRQGETTLDLTSQARRLHEKQSARPAGRNEQTHSTGVGTARGASVFESTIPKPTHNLPYARRGRCSSRLGCAIDPKLMRIGRHDGVPRIKTRRHDEPRHAKRAPDQTGGTGHVDTVSAFDEGSLRGKGRRASTEPDFWKRLARERRRREVDLDHRSVPIRRPDRLSHTKVTEIGTGRHRPSRRNPSWSG